MGIAQVSSGPLPSIPLGFLFFRFRFCFFASYRSSSSVSSPVFSSLHFSTSLSLSLFRLLCTLNDGRSHSCNAAVNYSVVSIS